MPRHDADTFDTLMLITMIRDSCYAMITLPRYMLAFDIELKSAY